MKIQFLAGFFTGAISLPFIFAAANYADTGTFLACPPCDDGESHHKNHVPEDTAVFTVACPYSADHEKQHAHGE